MSADKFLKAIGTGALTFAGLYALGKYSLYNVDGGERAVIWDMQKGVLPYTVGEGTHILFPIKQRAHIFEIRTRPRSITTTTGSKDLQNVNISLRVLFRPKVTALPEIFRSLGMDYDERVLPSIGNEVMKAVVAQYNAEELITRREDVSREIAKKLVEAADKFNIILQDVSITHLNFSKEFTQAVEAKQVAQQEAERQKFIVMKAEQEKKAAIIKAEGESEAARLIAEALQAGPGLIELRRIQAAREIANTIAKSRNITYLPKDMNLLIGGGNLSSPSPSR